VDYVEAFYTFREYRYRDDVKDITITVEAYADMLAFLQYTKEHPYTRFTVAQLVRRGNFYELTLDYSTNKDVIGIANEILRSAKKYLGVDIPAKVSAVGIYAVLELGNRMYAKLPAKAKPVVYTTGNIKLVTSGNRVELLRGDLSELAEEFLRLCKELFSLCFYTSCHEPEIRRRVDYYREASNAVLRTPLGYMFVYKNENEEVGDFLGKAIEELRELLPVLRARYLERSLLGE